MKKAWESGGLKYEDKVRFLGYWDGQRGRVNCGRVMAKIRQSRPGEKGTGNHIQAERKRPEEDQKKEVEMKLSNRNSPGFLQPWNPMWVEHHLLHPKNIHNSKLSDPAVCNSRGIYLHDYPLPVPEILNFFGFNLEASTAEIWVDEKKLLEPDEIKLERPFLLDFMGAYTAAARTVTLYLPTIRECAKCIGLEGDEEGIREVVRIHEYMHALHHLGAPANVRAKEWEPFGGVSGFDPAFLGERWALKETPTAIDIFVASRNHWFSKLAKPCPSRRLEFVAQAGTAIYIDYLEEVYGPRPSSKTSLREIFWILMNEQTSPYFLNVADFPKRSWPLLGGVFRSALRYDWERSAKSAEEAFRKIKNHGIAAAGLQGEQALDAVGIAEALG